MNGLWIVGIVACGVLLVVFLIVVAVAAQKQQRAAMEAMFAEQGFVVVHKPEQAARDAAWMVFEPFKQHLKYGAKGIQWIGRGIVEGREVVAVQHQYTVSTGQSTQHVVHYCVACRCPPGWPMVELKGQHLLHKIADALGASDIRLENEAFNKRWRVSAESEDQAILVLTPEVQAMLADAPSGDSWAIGRGWVRLSGRKLSKPEQLREGLGRPGRLLGGMPPELFVEIAP